MSVSVGSELSSTRLSPKLPPTPPSLIYSASRSNARLHFPLAPPCCRFFVANTNFNATIIFPNVPSINPPCIKSLCITAELRALPGERKLRLRVAARVHVQGRLRPHQQQRRSRPRPADLSRPRCRGSQVNNFMMEGRGVVLL